MSASDVDVFRLFGGATMCSYVCVLYAVRRRFGTWDNVYAIAEKRDADGSRVGTRVAVHIYTSK